MASLSQFGYGTSAQAVPSISALETIIRAAFALQRTERLAPDDALFWETDPAEHIFELVEGTIRLFRMMPDGRRAITGFAFEGDVLGVIFRNTYPHTAEAVTPVKIHRLRRSELEALLIRAPDSSRQFSLMISDAVAEAQNHILLLARKTATERVASFLVAIYRRLRRGDPQIEGVSLPMSRQDMADYLGLTVETVSREISRLRRSGLILLPEPQRFAVRDDAGLAALTGEAETQAPAHRRAS